MFELFFAPDGKAGGNSKDDIDFTKFKTPDDIEAKLNELDEVEDGITVDDSKVEDDIATPAKPPAEDKEEADKVIIPDEKEKEAVAETEKEKGEEVPAKAPEEDKAERTDKAILITEELISNLDLGDEEKKYLNKFKGQPLDAILKSYANAQKLIGKKKEELFKQTEIPKADIKIPEVKAPEEIVQAKNDLIHTQLAKEFPEVPKDPVDQKKWLADLNYDDPESALKFIEAKKQISQEVDTIWKQTEYLRQNSGKINQERFKSEAEGIEVFAKDKLGIDLKDYGYDFTIDKDGNNEILERLIASENNPDEFDESIVKSWNGIKIIDKGALVRKFYEKELPNIFKHVREGSRKEGFEAKTNKKVVQSLTTTPQKGKGNAKEITADQIKNINKLEQIDELLDAEDSKYFSH